MNPKELQAKVDALWGRVQDTDAGKDDRLEAVHELSVGYKELGDALPLPAGWTFGRENLLKKLDTLPAGIEALPEELDEDGTPTEPAPPQQSAPDAPLVDDFELGAVGNNSYAATRNKETDEVRFYVSSGDGVTAGTIEEGELPDEIRDEAIARGLLYDHGDHPDRDDGATNVTPAGDEAEADEDPVVHAEAEQDAADKASS